MKKLLETVSEIFLFFLLLIIFLMPLLVSFNLDPYLYSEQTPKVAGADDVVTSSDIDFDVEQIIEKSDRTSIIDSLRKKNLYEIRFSLARGGKLDESLRIGYLKNQGNKNTRFIFNLFGDKEALRGVKISTKLNESDYLLFNGETFNQVQFTLAPEAEEEINLQFVSNLSINYTLEMRFEIRGVSLV